MYTYARAYTHIHIHTYIQAHIRARTLVENNTHPPATRCIAVSRSNILRCVSRDAPIRCQLMVACTLRVSARRSDERSDRRGTGRETRREARGEKRGEARRAIRPVSKYYVTTPVSNGSRTIAFFTTRRTVLSSSIGGDIDETVNDTQRHTTP